MKVRTKEVKGGYKLELAGFPEQIIGIVDSGGTKKVCINDIVRLNGKRGEKGLMGRVIFLEEPFTKNKSNNVIHIQLENDELAILKFKELEHQNGSYNMRCWQN